MFRIYGKGNAASQLSDLMMRMRREAAGFESPVKPQIDSLVILDRSVDLLSTLPTQLTYEGKCCTTNYYPGNDRLSGQKIFGLDARPDIGTNIRPDTEFISGSFLL